MEAVGVLVTTLIKGNMILYTCTPQVNLSDEQSTVRAVRLQQRKALEGQQRLVEEDLSRYMNVQSDTVVHTCS